MSHGTILFVDDEEINRIVGNDILEDLGYEVFLASNGLEALSIFKKNLEVIDLVVLDMIMPKLNGHDTFLKMKEIDKECKVIIASGYSDDEDILRLKDKGLSAILSKPYKIPQLDHLLKELINHD